MADNLAIRDSWVVRVLRALKLVDVSPDGEVDHNAGADFIPNAPTVPTYDPLASLSSMASFPWVYAAVTALATDASMLKIRVTRGEGADAEPADDHPLARLLMNPSSRVAGTLFWRQIVTDLVLTGDAFILIAGSSQPEALLRLHPSRVRIMPQPDGQPGAYQYSGGGERKEYSYEQVLHIRTPSWADDPRSLWGVGAIQSLHNDLMTDKRTQELTASSAQTGRPTGIISPSEEGDRWSSEQIRLLRTAYEKQMSSGSGLLVMGGAVQYTPVGWSPKDMEFASVREMTRSAVLAAIDVPPTRVGLPSANYATSREQAKRYWESIRGRMQLIASEINRLAAMFPDGDSLSVHWDFSEVEALQESRSDRLNRVMTWVSMGVPVGDAAAYEGFDDLPTDNLLDPYGDMMPQPDEQAQDDEPADDVDVDNETYEAALAALVTRAPYDDIDFSVPQGVRDELERGLAWHEEGHSGDGLTPATVSWARRMANGEDISPDKAVKMRAWLARHEADKQGEGFSPGEPGFPSPGRVAWALWGGDPALSWSAKLVRQMEAADDEEKTSTGAEVSMDVGVAEWLCSDQHVCDDLTSKDAKAEYMRRFLTEFHTPYERALNVAVRRHLVARAARTAKRLADALPERKGMGDEYVVQRADLGLGWLLEVLASYQESALLKAQTRPIMQRMVQQAIARALAQANARGEKMSPEFVETTTRALVDDMAGNMEQATKDMVRSIIEKGLERGATIGELQDFLMKGVAFSPERALRVARTETTKAVNTASARTYQTLADRGIELEIYWLHAPGARDSHRQLGESGPIQPGEKFVIPGGEHAGKTATHPGGFGVAALDINCRCTISSRAKT